jgi:hypothetical protein
MSLAQKLSGGVTADAPKAEEGLLGKLFGDVKMKMEKKGTKK